MAEVATQSLAPHAHAVCAELRRARLRSIVALWELQLRQIEDSAYIHFRDQNLPKISELILAKRRLERRLVRVRQFCEQSEALES